MGKYKVTNNQDFINHKLPKLLKASYKNSKQQDAVAKDLGYIRLNKYSSVQTQVLDAGNHTVIVHRGSKNIQDYADDALIGLGLGNHTHRVRQDRRLTERVERETGKRAVHIGHSLGGYLAETSATKDAPVFTYNKHSVGFTGARFNPNEVDIHRYGDVASAFNQFKGKEGASHSHITVGSRQLSNYWNILKNHEIITPEEDNNDINIEKYGKPENS